MQLILKVGTGSTASKSSTDWLFGKIWSQSFYTSFNRVDIGGDTKKPLNTDHYYEASMGWLMTPPVKIPFVVNIGVGMSLNYGSAFKGGSLVLFFNQT